MFFMYMWTTFYCLIIPKHSNLGQKLEKMWVHNSCTLLCFGVIKVYTPQKGYN